MTAARPLASRNRKNRRLGERFFGSGVTGLPIPSGRSPVERGVRRSESWASTPDAPPRPNTAPPRTTSASNFCALCALKPSDVELYVPASRPRPGVGSNGSQPYPRNQTSTHVCASWSVTCQKSS